jgi:hypothetical protein
MRIKSTTVGFLLINSSNPPVTDNSYEKHYRKTEFPAFAKGRYPMG